MSNEQQPAPLALQPANPEVIQVGGAGIQLRSFDDYWTFSKVLTVSGLAPKGLEKPESVMIVLQYGAELGLPPMASVQNIAAINGRPSLWGDGLPAVIRGSGQLEEISEWFERNGARIARLAGTEFPDDLIAVCRVKRKGEEAVEGSFSVADAKRAKLWSKAGPWTEYPQRMLKMRARSYALRDAFPDALRGIRMAEELQDEYEAEPMRNVTQPTAAYADEQQDKNPAAPAAPNAGRKPPKRQQRQKDETAPPAGAPAADPAPAAEPAAEPAPAAQEAPVEVLPSEQEEREQLRETILASMKEVPAFDHLTFSDFEGACIAVGGLQRIKDKDGVPFDPPEYESAMDLPIIRFRAAAKNTISILEMARDQKGWLVPSKPGAAGEKSELFGMP